MRHIEAEHHSVERTFCEFVIWIENADTQGQGQSYSLIDVFRIMPPQWDNRFEVEAAVVSRYNQRRFLRMLC